MNVTLFLMNYLQNKYAKTHVHVSFGICCEGVGLTALNTASCAALPWSLGLRHIFTSAALR